MRSWLIPSLVLVGGMLLPAVGWAQPRPSAQQARVVPAPATEGGNMDEVIRVDPSQLVCADGRSLCEVTAAQTVHIEALRSEVVALRAQVTTVAARTSPPRPRTTPPGRAPSRTPQPPPVLVRVRRLEETTDATALRLEQLAQNLTVPAQSEICRLLRANPALATPPGVDCGTVDERLRSVIQAASRAVTPPPAR